MPLSLLLGFVASDDGQCVLQEGSFPRITCLAHCVGLVVREFLHSNEEVDQVMAAARKVCAHFEHFYQGEGEGEETGQVLAHSLLQTLRSNRQITEIHTQEDYVLAPYVDPRFKNNMASFMPEGEGSLHRWTQRLVNKVAKNIRHVRNRGTSWRQTQQQREGSASERCKCLWDTLEDFGLISMAPVLLDSAKAQVAQIVEIYLQDIMLQSASAEPLVYWQLKRDVWLPLFQVPVQHLSCPRSSLCSEQLFSMAGTIMRNRQTCLSTGSVESLAFIKMNKHLLPWDYWVPEHAASARDKATRNMEEEEEQEEDDEEKEEEDNMEGL
uniref:HAT C-terminal dimerisation domain-containing protein n=1 Tax=Chelonoidis abingdonii TaxID=106734 RepID=A0A8C0GC22_CHEAB